MRQWRISAQELRHALETGEVIEDYPDDKPHPSRLVLGWNGTKPVDVVAADNIAGQETIVITVYEPDPDRWEPGFRRRKAP